MRVCINIYIYTHMHAFLIENSATGGTFIVGKQYNKEM